MRQGTPGYVYALYLPELGATKVGRSTTPRRRLKNIKSGTPTARGSHKSSYFISTLVENHEHLEKSVHEALKDKRIKGEWFDCTNEEAKAVILRLAKPATEDYLLQVKKDRASRTESVLDFGKQLFEPALHRCSTCHHRIISASQTLRNSVDVLVSKGFSQEDAISVANRHVLTDYDVNIAEILGIPTCEVSPDMSALGDSMLHDSYLDTLHEAAASSGQDFHAFDS